MKKSDELSSVFADIAANLARIADHFDPPPPDKVGTPYVAERLGCTTDYVAVMVREGAIPHHCLVPGTGTGKPWKFFRDRIDRWIEQR
ncbi:helix-turn-helix domain-containing protein [Anatilimnocola floriformis]|uniref:helix-turn-helix domain-containing protein n=1 Tax=Anatilimnocola floriformis TaxID=2948575 RepID=UPI0020C3F53E|nr:helix-turn-helix domain-containing protein [Anatilimnocola floriformis]